MDASFSPEQEDLRRVLRQFLTETSTSADVRQAAATPAGYDLAAWRRLNETFGLAGLVIPEEYGGLGLSFVELAIVLEEMGRVLYPGPYLASAVLATAALLRSDDDLARKELLPGVAAGTTVATLAHRAGQVTARRSGSGYLLSGHADHVLDGHVADVIILPVVADRVITLFAVRAPQPGVTARRVPTVDQTRSQARVELRDAVARPLAVGDTAAQVLAGVSDVAGVALAAEAVGGASRCLEMAVEYGRVRMQFGRPIASFQALKHRYADLYVEVETARSAAYYAAWAAAELTDDLPEAARVAQSHCAEVYRHAAAENIQLHGGIGFTWEHDAHLYLKRATTNDLLFGSSRYQRACLADLVGL